ncbi:transmembrane bax inhibitor motif-containing protein [Ophiostoma piceae UAMH 11346]|uniref:Transmembrane bax inhibitor motif-containing protein n=1 Tax=Ophiostoma piceae (strain UAMH 11346) TaxID=1262450 RepID=S3CNB7_OPHP1|nr:transmembrane bax inhibitor motif-containing protein [Ophiostoma piceae UAMH 11346]
MSSAKYTPAPVVDPDEHLEYTEAPPSYQAEASASARAAADDDTERLFSGTSRQQQDSFGSDDVDGDLPDDFKFGGSVAEASVSIRNQFVRKVYAILTVQLLATAALSAVSFMSDGYRQWVQSHPGLVFVSLFGAMGFLGLTYWKRKNYPANLLFLGGFTLLEAYSISVIVSFYDAALVLNAVVLTGGIFAFLTLFACQTRYDFTSWMPYLFGSLWALILFGFMAMFFPYNSTAELIYGGISALIFSGYILVDTQMVLRKHHVEEEIAAAIALYLDIINLFLAILRILNSQQNN